MNDFASTEEHGSFYFVALLEEAHGMILFELVIMFIRVGPELHFLDRDVLLMLSSLMLFLVLLIKILAVIHDPANRRSCGGRDFYQVQSTFFGNLDCGLWGQNPELFILIVYNSNLARTNSVIDPYIFIDNLSPPVIVRLSETNGNLNKRSALFSTIRRD